MRLVTNTARPAGAASSSGAVVRISRQVASTFTPTAARKSRS